MNSVPTIPKLPICCNPVAFDRLTALLPDMDAERTLLPATMAICEHTETEMTLPEVDDRLGQMSRVIAARCHGTQQQGLLAHLHDYLFEELGFEGNSEDYYNPQNSLLPSVMYSRKGLPITLSLLYKLIADRVGLNVWGVGLPGHFVVGVNYCGKTAWVDPFAAGRLLTLQEAKSRVSGQFGSQLEWSDRLLAPVGNRYWITRVLQNLLSSYTRSESFVELASVLELEVLLWPDELRLRRDLAMVFAKMGRQDVAWQWLEHYLHLNPTDPQSADLRQMLADTSH